MKTQEERDNAIARLEENKTKCRRYSVFGNDCYAAIDTMIEVIENEMDEEDVYDNYPSCDENGNDCPSAHYLWQCALIASEWLKGEHDLKDILYPER
ncbi:MAG: hypothetical protein LBQ74_03785 [Prevotella sp.]|jgi:hypothetical protein|nr:hypothetical protein [Prevotella sp.]